MKLPFDTLAGSRLAGYGSTVVRTA